MPSFSDSIFLFVLALLLFGPKRLPVLARELGKWVGEFRRASNEFKMQMEDELRISEQADRQKQIAAMEAAAPVAPPILDAAIPSEPATPQLEASSTASEMDTPSEIAVTEHSHIETAADSESQPATEPVPATTSQPAYEMIDGVRKPLPIATSGELRIMPPSTGLPTPQQTSGPRDSALKGLIDAIPPAPEESTEIASASEIATHGN